MGIPEGVALFFKRDKFHLEETKTFHLKDLAVHCFKQTATPKMREVALLAALRHKISNNLLVVGKSFLHVYIREHDKMQEFPQEQVLELHTDHNVTLL